MHSQTLQATFGGLLHDVGKLAFRSGIAADSHAAAGYHWLAERLTFPDWQPVLDCARYHHADALHSSETAPDAIAPIVYLADGLLRSAAVQPEEAPGAPMDVTRTLHSVFTHLNGTHTALTIEPTLSDGTLRLPNSGKTASSTHYAQLLSALEEELSHVTLDEAGLTALLAALEHCTANVPASVLTDDDPDVSLYDHLRITAAASACISEYLLDRSITDHRAYLLDRENSFRAEKAFLMYSADFSGIQKFIYTVATSGAQRSLRSRSFFLELLMEHFVDELLTACGLSRVNLIYVGGGHCYILLPNTQRTIEQVELVRNRMNDWLIEQFGIRLYMAHGWSACSMNDLTNKPASSTPYKNIFRNISAAISKNKLQRYTVAQIIRLNHMQQAPGHRECTVCGSTALLREDRCAWCARFEDISHRIQDAARVAYYVTSDPVPGYDIPLPTLDGEAYLSLLTEAEARSRQASDSSLRRIYTQNQNIAGLMHSIRLDVCDYFASNQNTDLAEGSSGIRRLAVCRMDVDNLGHAFVAGFEQEHIRDAAGQYRYVSLGRTAALSRQLSLFFKRYMHQILTEGTELQVSVVYSGGDDVFLLGAWNHIIQAALRIRQYFHAFTGGALTISCGIGMFHPTYPIRIAADDTATLEQHAKSEPGKNSIALFDSLQAHTYPWSIFADQVMGEKFELLERFFCTQDERGMAFLYRMTDLLRAAEHDKLNLARYAYMLARLHPASGTPAWAIYDEFSRRMYDWACEPHDRRQLITAIYLYVYMNRKVE